MYQHIKLLVKGQGVKLKVPLLLFMLLCLVSNLFKLHWLMCLATLGSVFRLYKNHEPTCRQAHEPVQL